MKKYEAIYALVKQIPPGKVATYGQIARLVGGCTARMVGYAMAATPSGEDIPWHRVINSKGKISPHGLGYGSALQKARLLEEGILFDEQNTINLNLFGWFSGQDFPLAFP